MHQPISIQRAANVLRSSRSHVYLLIKQKRLQIVNIEGKHVLSQDSVERYKTLKNQLESIQEEMRKEYYQNAG